jgi:hypothetical protein
MADDWALETLGKSASKPNKKIITASRLICVHSLSIKWETLGLSVAVTLMTIQQQNFLIPLAIFMGRWNFFMEVLFW